MSENYDQENSPHGPGQGYLSGPTFGGPGYGYPVPPPPPPRNHHRALIITGAVALAFGVGAGALVNGLGSSPTGTATATSKTSLSAGQIASRVDPGLVDVVSTDGLAQAESAGTGIVLSSTGEILTNNHVISGATSIKVIDIGNGRTYTAKVVGYDASADVAVIQAQGASGLTTASLGNSSTVGVGSSVVALGNAQGKGGTPSMATGTVTGLNQSITASDDLSGTQEQLTGLIETNADIQPGDSGGPLVNPYGQVIGMDTAASSSYQFQDQGSSATQAYSIPINTAISIANQIEAGSGSSTVHIGATAFLGVGVGSSQNGFGNSGNGAYLQNVEQGSPAANAGLTEGDTLTSVGGVSVSSSPDIQHVLVKYHPGDKIQVSWLDQSGQSQTATVTLATGPAA
ncbi:MAG: trypsin-like peptidase domain-containing protein [Streptosporangiaceae bacterium]|nr:trypsin-like peptidase domain-containing protein [Streptosporangiaceae bacterium]